MSNNDIVIKFDNMNKLFQDIRWKLVLVIRPKLRTQNISEYFS